MHDNKSIDSCNVKLYVYSLPVNLCSAAGPRDDVALSLYKSIAAWAL